MGYRLATHITSRCVIAVATTTTTTMTLTPIIYAATINYGGDAINDHGGKDSRGSYTNGVGSTIIVGFSILGPFE